MITTSPLFLMTCLLRLGGDRVYIYTCIHPPLSLFNFFYFKDRQEYILESRKIQEQDREYQESLRIDRKKRRGKTEGEGGGGKQRTGEYL